MHGKEVFLIFLLIFLVAPHMDMCCLANCASISEGSDPRFSIKLLWFRGFSEPISYDFDNWPILIDTNNDSNLEIIAADHWNILIFSHNGELLANFSKVGRYAGNPQPFVADYDGDGRLEYFIASEDRVFILDVGLRRVDDIINFPDRIFGMIYGNWDEDKDMELLISCYKQGLFVYDFKDRETRLVIDKSIVNGREVLVWGYIRPMGDGKVVFFNFILRYCALGVVDVLSGKVLWAVNILEYGMYSTSLDNLLVGDFDGDGVKEIVVPGWYPELYIFSGDDGSLEAYFNFTNYVGLDSCTDYFAVCDLNGDGVMEGIFALTPYFGYWSNKSVGILAVINMRSYTIEKLITYSKEEFGYHGISPPSLNILDANLDGVYDILVMNFGNITIYDGRTLTPMFTFNVSAFFKRMGGGWGCAWFGDSENLVVRDLDGDGRIEMVNLCGRCSISVYSLVVKPFLVPLIYWSMPYGCPDAFGCFENFDRDHDRVADWVEAQFGFSNNSVDSDGDGVSDFDEILSIYRNMSYGNASPEYLWVFISLVFIPPIAITAVLVYCVRRRKNVGMRPRCESASYSPCLDMLGCM